MNSDILGKLVDPLPEAEIAEEPIGPKFADSIRRGLAQADAGDTVVCCDESEMVEKLLDALEARDLQVG